MQPVTLARSVDCDVYSSDSAKDESSCGAHLRAWNARVPIFFRPRMLHRSLSGYTLQTKFCGSKAFENLVVDAAWSRGGFGRDA